MDGVGRTKYFSMDAIFTFPDGKKLYGRCTATKIQMSKPDKNNVIDVLINAGWNFNDNQLLVIGIEKDLLDKDGNINLVKGETTIKTILGGSGRFLGAYGSVKTFKQHNFQGYEHILTLYTM